jgi:DNA-binding transcriptional MerR regulator
MTYPLVRGRRDVLLLDLESVAGAAGMHPQHVRRLVALGLLQPTAAGDGELRFPPSQVLELARIQRLRAGLGINYAALGLVLDLLDRVAALESELRSSGARRRPAGETTQGRTGEGSWISTA